MLQLVKAPKAEADLIDIWLYVAEDQPINADRLLDRLNDAALLVAETPLMGVDRPDLSKDIKSFPVENYILFYRIKPEVLELVRVLSASRDIGSVDF
ncbi:type II toxin-antitoxin system RelE/ParE family toxin [Thalassolituus sp.]|jgi:plasmid stabilization system protein ParE|uniref:type II toxin-antitoxin system RelE/ParE family toxin n=1 Tax=Thalassolituus sp. TaxID=2030822 RepID=UPI002A7FBB38|nr:type II toxin-antitoxin system RelE/ParE family toxin [Thalassolituus sp.]|tara:strand:- start:856 stop:1146 length:291 start_codon:yes stop_codon:yes gene_type:complete